MSWFRNRRNQENKKRLQRICFISKAAFNLAVNVYGWLNPAVNLLGAAVIPPLTDATIDLLDNWNVDLTLENQYFSAVEDSLARVEIYFRDKHGKRKLIQELAQSVDTIDTFNMKLEDVIRNAETFRDQYMTSLDVKEVVQCFEQVFREEVARHEQLSHYYIFKDTQDTVDILKRIHILLNADNKQLEVIYSYVNDIKNDTTQIKASVQEIKTGVNYLKELMLWIRKTMFSVFEILLQSMVIFFAFILAAALLNTQTTHTMEIYVVVLISELLIRSLSVHVKGFKVISSVIITQTLFITACSLLITKQYIYEYPEMLPCIVGCALVGVGTKYCLQYYQSNHTEK